MQHNAVNDERWGLAMTRQWFIDLDQGTGAAANLTPEVRERLQWTTVDIAAELANVELREQEASRHAREEEERAREREREEARRASDRARQEAANTRARSFTKFTLGTYLVMAVTVLVPWLIGLNFLRDSWLRPRSPLLYFSSSRNSGDYFGTDYLTGLAVLSLVTAALLLIAKFAHASFSTGRLVLAIGLAVSAVFMWFPAASSTWETAELATVRAEATSVPSMYQSCGVYPNRPVTPQISLMGAGGIIHTWTALVLSDQDEACTEVEVWDGARYVSSVETPNILDGAIAAFAGNSPDDSYVVFAGEGPIPDCENSYNCQPEFEIVGGFGLTETSVAWTHQLRLSSEDDYDPLATATDDRFYAVENPLTTSSRLLAFDPATGDIVWATHCPSDVPMMSDLQATTNGRGVYLQCDSTESTHREFAVSADGTLTDWGSE